MGNCLGCENENTINKTNTVKNLKEPVRKWDGTSDLKHSGENIWLSKEETKNYFNEYIEFYKIYHDKNHHGVFNYNIHLDPWSQSISLIWQCTTCTGLKNIPYIGHEWTCDKITLNTLPVGLIIPRYDLRSPEIIEGFANKIRQNKNQIKSLVGKDLSSIVSEY